jgi:hypothetical protein
VQLTPSDRRTILTYETHFFHFTASGHLRVAFLFREPAMTPAEPLVAVLVPRLEADLREDFEERAAIVQFDANVQRPHAECLALLDVLRRHPDALLRIRTLRVELEGRHYVVLASDRETARSRLDVMRPLTFGDVDLAHVVRTEFDGLAFVTRAL